LTENATDDEIIKKAGVVPYVLNDDCIGDNIESIEDDEECPAIGYELL
jgi:hypothetical protein